MRNLCVLILVCLTLGACSAGADKAASEALVQQFRRQMDAGRFQQIYRTSSDEFRQSGSEDTLVGFLATVQARLGRVRSSNQTGWHFNATPAASTTTLTYATEFERGSGTETFVFRVTDGRAALVGYHINSNQLMLPAPARAAPGVGKPSVDVLPDA